MAWLKARLALLKTRLANRPRPSRRTVAAVSVVAAVVVIGTGLVMQGSLRGTPTASPGASPGRTAAAASPGPTGDWAAVDLAAIPAVASLEPASHDDTGVPADTAFTLTSLAGEKVGALAGRLEVSPATQLVLTPSTDASATLKPAKPLQPGQTYRFALRTPDGSLAGSWLFRVRGPIQVASTIPGPRTTGVPVRTGVEVTFNQEGVADMSDHFVISPAVKGTFERHGRTQVFVPEALKPATLYTVTVKAGLARTGTDLMLPSDVVFSFETTGPEIAEMRLQFGREVIEASPAERPVVAVRVVAPDSEELTLPKTADVRVYRLPSLDAAERTLAGFLAAPRWSNYQDPLIPTDGLTVASSFTATLEPLRDNLLMIRFPDRLDAGAYVVEIAGARKAHAFLQITRVSAWVSVLSDRTVVWANDVTTGRPLPDATIALAGGPVFGRSGADGLAIAVTPTGLLPPVVVGEDVNAPASPILRVTSAAGDAVLVPFGIGSDGELYRGEWWEKTEPADETYWALLFSDRGFYRSDDRIEIWGYLRSRDGSKHPSSVELRLVHPAQDGHERPSIATTTAKPGTTGAFTAALSLAGAPLGAYQVQAVVDGRVVVSRWLEVTIIRKPAYRMDFATDHRAVLAGTTVRWTATATFFDGTTVPSLELQMAGGDMEEGVRATTDAAGLASLSLKARTTAPEGEAWEDPSSWDIEVTPTGPEGAEIVASASVVVFPSAYDLQASGVVTSGRLEVKGSLHQVDLAKVERQIKAGSWDGAAAGLPVARHGLDAVVTELVPVRRLVGNDYDFVEKVVRPRYEYDIQRNPVRSLTVETAADGRFTVALAVPDPTHEYEIVLSTRDGASRTAQRTIQAGQPVQQWWTERGVLFETADGKDVAETAYGIGAPVVWRMTEEGKAFPSGGTDRYLYLVAQRGLRSAAVTDAATFRHTFAAADAPGVFVIGVRFTGSTYAPKAAGWANFDPSKRRIKVAVTAARERYRPGEDVTLSVRTTRADGSPVAATVVLQAVDEKLYAIGGASLPEPLHDLYQRVDSGIVRLTSTHQVPTMSGSEGEGGDTTGGGPRTDFKDTLLFRELTTDASGRASVTVRLSDDLTSWHVTASAVTASLEAGAGDVLVPVGLPFFVETTVADTYLVSDRPVITVRAYGDSLRAGDPVEFTVQSTTLGMPATKVSGKAFEAVGVALPPLTAGTRSVDVGATTTRKDTAGKPLSDRLVRPFEVVTSRLTAARTSYGLVRDGLPSVPAGPGLATYTFADAGRGRFLPVLLGLAEPGGARLDRLIGQSISRQLLIADFGREPGSLPPFEFDSGRYAIGIVETENGSSTMAGVALLPYGGVDPWLAARVAILAPEALDANRVLEALNAIRDDPRTQRDLAIATLAAEAALGEPVMADLLEARRIADLTPMERIYLALGFQALGDDASALQIERDLLDNDGERLGSWVRLRMGGDPQTSVEASALLSVVAAGLGDPVATGLADYVVSNPGKETTHSLDLAAYATRGLERTPASTASFSYTVAGKRTVVELQAGDAFTVSLTADQRLGLSAETLSGQVAVAVESRATVEPGALKPLAGLTLTRPVPATLPPGQVVVVDLTATFAESAPVNGCYDVLEIVPSGLAPLAIGTGEADDRGFTSPSSVVGQEVRFCAVNDALSGHSARLRYRARIVNPGTFTWEPAVMQLAGAPEALAITPTGTTTIGGS